MDDKILKPNERLGKLAHGQILQSRALGNMSVVSRSSAMARGFVYPVSVQAIALASSLLILHEDFYCVVEELDSSRVTFLLPLCLAGGLANGVDSSTFAVRRNTFEELKVLRLLTTQLNQVNPIGAFYRNLDPNLNKDQELCLYQTLDKNQNITALDESLNRLLDFALLLWDAARTDNKAPLKNLARSVESHRY